MSRILLTGKDGLIGWELQRSLAPLGEVIALDRRGMDLESPDSIVAVIRDVRPQLIVNAAAYTAVDRAEDEPQRAQAVNALAPGVIAEEARKLGAGLVHYSTDYVFDGAKASPYTESDAPNPLSVYGQTKLAGERAVQEAGGSCLIFRTSWIYADRGKNFLLTIRRLASEKDELRVVNDQRGVPNWCRMIAEMTALALTGSMHRSTRGALAWDGPGGLYHLCGAGEATWYEFACAIVEQAPPDAKRPPVVPIATRELGLRATRPAYSVLSSEAAAQTFGLHPPDWRTQLRLCLA